MTERSPTSQEQAINDEVQLISDSDGLAVIGDPAVVDRFLASEGLVATRDFGLPTVRGVMSTGAAVAAAGSGIAAGSGRWVKLTKESAELVKKHGLRESKSGLKTGVVKGSKGQVKTFVQFAKGPSTALTNPAVLAGAAGVMAHDDRRFTLVLRQPRDPPWSHLWPSHALPMRQTVMPANRAACVAPWRVPPR